MLARTRRPQAAEQEGQDRQGAEVAGEDWGQEGET